MLVCWQKTHLVLRSNRFKISLGISAWYHKSFVLNLICPLKNNPLKSILLRNRKLNNQFKSKDKLLLNRFLNFRKKKNNNNLSESMVFLIPHQIVWNRRKGEEIIKILKNPEEESQMSLLIMYTHNGVRMDYNPLWMDCLSNLISYLKPD